MYDSIKIFLLEYGFEAEKKIKGRAYRITLAESLLHHFW